MTIAASYLPLAGEGERDPSHYVPELSRRARGFATWAMLKHLGRQGVAALIDQCCASARLAADLLGREPGIAILNEVALNQLVIRFGAGRSDEDGDALTRKTIEKIQADGLIFAGGAKWHGRDVLRLSVTNFQTTSDQAETAAKSIITAFRSVSGNSPPG
jgi:glutamate/tyrosine decarboxylase-like PLP-dependent enzyme